MATDLEPTGPENQLMSDKLESVVTKARKREEILEKEAVQYADSVEFDISDHIGCYVICCMRCCGCHLGKCGGVPCCCVYHRACCGDDCLWTPWCIGGVCPYPCMFCPCREGNQWVNRDKYGHMSNKLVLVDKERGTLAWYFRQWNCSDPEIQQAPKCYLWRLCC